METVQQTVVHLDHGGIIQQPSPMAYAQRSAQLHRPSQPAEGLSFKAQRPVVVSAPSAAPHSTSPAVPASVPAPVSTAGGVPGGVPGGPGAGPGVYQVRIGGPQPTSYHRGLPGRDGPGVPAVPAAGLPYPPQMVYVARDSTYRPAVVPVGHTLEPLQQAHLDRPANRAVAADMASMVQVQAPTVALPREGTVVLPMRQQQQRIPVSSAPIVSVAAPGKDAHAHAHAQPEPVNQPAELAHQDMLLRWGTALPSAPSAIALQPMALGGVQPAPSTISLRPMPPAMDAGPPFKKIRLGDAKQEMQPLRVDTREQPAYTPQVEAISPTLPNETNQDEQFRLAKDDLLNQIHKMDLEIAKGEKEHRSLKSKEQDLVVNAYKLRTRHRIKKEEPDAEEISSPPKHQSPAQKIYAYNRNLAYMAHEALSKLGPEIDYPLYNQPSDTVVYHENKRKYLTFKETLMDHLKKKHVENEERDKYLANTYSRLMQEWVRKVERMESSQKRKAKEAKNREFFEKVFTELRKAREDKERFNRVGARIKSEADMEEIMDGLQEQEMEDKKMRSMAVVPPILLNASQRRLSFQNNNGLIDDYSTEYKERQLLNVWTASEKETFREKYLQHPKNFGLIASYLDRKTVSDCVQYYYLSKKSENYKQLLRKSRQRTRSSRNNPGKPNNLANNAGLVDILSSTGVTTRLQREQLQQKREEPRNREPERQATDSPKPPTSNSPNTVNNSNSITNCASGNSNFIGSHLQNDTASQDVKKGESKLENKKKERRKEEKKKKESEQMESSDDDISEQEKPVGTQPCILCKQQVDGVTQSRLLPRAQAAQYGLREDEVAAGARVCNPCRCKAVRSRYVHCPLPSCPNAKGRVKRVRPFPPKWAELSAEQKEPIIAEFQIPPGVSKACSACFNRISRRINPSEENSASGDASMSPSPGPGNSLRWTEDETELLKKALREHGTNWQRVSEAVGGTKTHHQCKNYYFNYRKKIGLDALVQEYHKVRENHLGEERKPALTDEEESGSSTSSCDEVPPSTNIVLDSNDANAATKAGAAAATTTTAAAAPGTTTTTTTTTTVPGAGPSASAAAAATAAAPGTGPATTTAAATATPVLPVGGALATAVPADGDKAASPAPVGTPPASTAPTPPTTAALTATSATSVTPSPSPAPNGTLTPIPAVTAVTTTTTSTTLSSLATTTALTAGVPALTTSQARTTSESSDQLRPTNKEDYDSSATETADEGQGGAEPSPAVLAASLGGHPPGPAPPGAPGVVPAGAAAAAGVAGAAGAAGGQANGPSSPRVTTVKDLMLSVIEVSLMKTQAKNNDTAPPTISSILNSENSFVGPGRDFRPGGPAAAVGAAAAAAAAAADKQAVVVTNSHHGERPDRPDVKDAANAAHHPDLAAGAALGGPKEGLVVLQEPQTMPRGDAPEDLSVKRPRDGPGPATLGIAAPHPGRNPSPALLHPLQEMTRHLIRPPQGAPGGPQAAAGQPGAPLTLYYHGAGAPPHHPAHGAPATPHLVMGPRSLTPQHGQHVKQPLKVVPPTHPVPVQSKLSPNMVGTHGHAPHSAHPAAHGAHAPKAGSITHGTPVSSPQRYNEGLLRGHHPHQPVGKEGVGGGSITQGTPVHLPTRLPATPMYDYYKRQSPSGVVYQAGVHPAGHPPPHSTAPIAVTTTSSSPAVSSGGFTSPYPHSGARAAPSYTVEQQLNSRQIIMADYYTSQQMHGSRRPNDKGSPLYYPPAPVGASGHSPRASPGPGGGPPSQPPTPQSSPQPVSKALGGASHPPPPHTSGTTVYIQKFTTQPSPVPQRTPPPQARQSIIQRHNTTPQPQAPPPQPPPQHQQQHQRPLQHFSHPPPGHEAFSSLVDLAVQQPSLPVPQPVAHHHPADKRNDRLPDRPADRMADRMQDRHHEGLGKTMADSLRERERDQRTPPGPAPGQADRMVEIQRQHLLIQEQQHRQQQQQQQQQQLHHHQPPRQHPQPISHHLTQARLADQHRLLAASHAAGHAAAHNPRHTPSPQHPPQHPPPSSQAAQVTPAPSPSQREPSVVNRSTPGPPPVSAAPSAGPPPGAPGGAAASGPGRPSSTSGDSTLTAASVIDAIITHTINEGVPGSNTSHPGPLTSRLGDRLFSGFHSSAPQMNEAPVSKSSPLKGAATAESAADAANSSAPSNSTGSGGAPPAAAAPPKKTLGDHIDSIITKDLNAPSTPSGIGGYPRTLAYPPFGVPSSGAAVAPGAQSVEELAGVLWKQRRREEHEAANARDSKGRSTPQPPTTQGQGAAGGQAAGDERSIIRIAQMSSSPRKPGQHVEPVSPPESSAPAPPATTAAHWMATSSSHAAPTTASSAVTSVAASVVAADPMAFLQQRRYFPEPRQMSPLDYVKNRIVEVMRTSEDDKVTDSRKEDGDAAASAPAAAKAEGRSASGSPRDAAAEDNKKEDGEKPPSAGPPASTTTQPHSAPYVQTTTYTYPFSALSVPQAAVAPQTGAAGAAPKPPALLPPTLAKEREPVAEPKPLLSSQYEALSDED